MREPGGLPSAGDVLTKLTPLLERDDEAVHHLSDVILGDLSPTQRVLHVANTLPFRTGSVPVTTVTRAIMLLGFNRVRAIAVSLVLLDGLADMTELMARGADVKSVIRAALETLYSGLGFGRAALVLRDAASGQMRSRMAVGAPKPLFAFRPEGMADLFSAALARLTDLHIADAGAEKIRARLPGWFARDFAATKSFLLMPLAIGARAIGFFYADRDGIDEAGLATDELAVLRSLRGQVVLALRAR